MIWIGIDPGTQTGYAVWSSRDKYFPYIKTLDFWSCARQMKRDIQKYRAAGEDVSLVIEDPEQNTFIYREKLVGREKLTADQNFRAQLSMAQDVGGNKREGRLLIALAEHYRSLGKVRQVIAKRPEKGGGTKYDDKAFKNLTKHKGRTSEHARDAAMMVFGK